MTNRNTETGLTEWETRMAKLVGLDESTPADMDGSNLDPPPQLQPDELTNSATQQPLSANPFAKAGLVGAGTLAVVMFAGGFLSQIMSNDKPQVTQNAIRSIPPQPKTKPQLQQLQEEVEGLKTKLALSEQLDAVKAAQQKLRMVKPTPSTPRIAAQPTPQVQPRIPRDVSMSTIRRQPQPPQIRIVEVPKIVKVDRVVNVPQPQSQPQLVSKPVAQKPKPTLPVLTQIVPPPELPAPISQQPLIEIAPPPQPNPLQEWARLAKLGSYGQVSVGKNQTVSDRTSPQRVQVARKVEEKETATTPRRETRTRTARQSTRKNPKTIPAGSSAKAVLATPIYGETTKSSRRNDDEEEDNNVYVVRLEQTLKAADGTAALPIGSQIFTKINSISDSGLMRLEIEKIMVRENGEIVEKSVPQNALMIRGKKGKPLIAKQYGGNNSSIARRDAISFLAGGVGKAAELINRNESEVVFRRDGEPIGVTNVNRNPSLAAGILEGGTKTVVPQISRRNQRAISEMSRKTNIWFLPQGKEVEIFVNQETQL
ncbi:MAG: TrbI/VirB10 family protein [Rivularia sp. (in: cyanobacteria)]